MANKVLKGSGSGQECCDNADAADCLAQGHPKSGAVPIAWGMKGQQSDDGEDPCDACDNGDDAACDDCYDDNYDARSQSFNKAKAL